MDLTGDVQEDSAERKSAQPSAETRVKNRRKRYLDLHPEYFSADLELAGRLALSFPIMILMGRPVIRSIRLPEIKANEANAQLYRPPALRPPHTSIPDNSRERGGRPGKGIFRDPSS